MTATTINAISATIDIPAYLSRIGYEGNTEPNLTTLQTLQLCHMQTVAFENLDVAASIEVDTSLAWSVAKIVERRRGGWCFELNGAFGALLATLGFSVRNLAAAVLLDGPNTVVDHLCLEVSIDDTAYLVDVGFGRSFTKPLELNNHDEQDGGAGRYQLIPSPQGTTLAEVVDGVPEARYRFKRVHHDLSDFDEPSTRLQADADSHWRTKPFATRVLDQPTDRVTLLRDRLKIERSGEIEETLVAREEWAATLERWFAMSAPAGLTRSVT